MASPDMFRQTPTSDSASPSPSVATSNTVIATPPSSEPSLVINQNIKALYIPIPQDSDSSSSCPATPSAADSDVEFSDNDLGLPASPICDDFIDNWDLIVRRCPDCRRPFTTQALLQSHITFWHTDPSPRLSAPYSKYRVEGHYPKTTEAVVANGDLILIVPASPDGTRQFRVWSQVLRSASTVFDSRLSELSEWPEAQSVRLAALDFSSPAIMSLEIDDVDASAALQVLLVLHHKISDSRFSARYGQRSFELLVKIAEFVETYELFEAIAPWMRGWLASWKRKMLKPGYEDFFTIAWVFGSKSDLLTMARELVFRGKVKPGRDYQVSTLVFDVANNGIVITKKLSNILPWHVAHELLRLRTDLINPIRSLFNRLQSYFTYIPKAAGEVKARVCMSNILLDPTTKLETITSIQRRMLCDALQNGHLLQTMGIHNLNSDDFWNQPIRIIKKVLEGIKPVRFRDVHNGAIDHIACDWVGDLQVALGKWDEDVWKVPAEVEAAVCKTSQMGAGCCNDKTCVNEMGRNN